MSNAARAAVGTLTVALVLLAGSAAPTGTSILSSPHGDLPDGSIGASLALGQGTFLVCAEGPDGNMGTADDRVLLVRGAGGAMPIVTFLATPGLSDFSGRLVRLTATRALVTGAGPNLTWGNADDVVYLLDGIGTTNTVTGITVGYLGASDAYTPEALGPDRAVVYSLGPNGAGNGTDDEAVVLTSLGGMNVVTHLAAPRVPSSGRSKPVALSPTSFLLSSNGPDAAVRTADDVVYLFTNVGTAAVRTDITVPRLFSRSPGRPVRLSATTALVSTSGADTTESNADDAVALLTSLGGMNIVTPIVVGGGIFDYGAGLATPLTQDLAVIASCGPDGSDTSADDGVVVLSGLGTSNTATFVTLGYIDEDGECRPSRLSVDSCALPTGGMDTTFGNMDDQVVLLSGVGETNAIARITVGGAQDGITSKVVPLAHDAFMISTAGPDFNGGTADDTVVVVSDALDDAPLVETVGMDGGLGSTYGLECVAVPLGGGVAVLSSSGTDLGQGSGSDDRIRVISGLPGTAGLKIKNVKILFKAESPEKGEKISLKAKLVFPATPDLAGDDVTLTLGNITQFFPAGSFVRKGANFKYSDNDNVNGPVTKVIYKAKSGSLLVKTKGVGTGAENTVPAYMAFSLETGESYFGEVVAGTVFTAGIKYKAPR
jgi:hypothetical protein